MSDYDNYLWQLAEDYNSECKPRYTSDGDYAPNCMDCGLIECPHYEENH